MIISFFFIVLITPVRAQYYRLQGEDFLDFEMGMNCTYSDTNLISQPQLQCISGPCQDAPFLVICHNLDFVSRVEYTASNISWNCTAQIVGGGATLGDYSVQCEVDPTNPYFVWAGSCALLYTLIDPSESVDASSASASTSSVSAAEISAIVGGTIGGLIVLVLVGYSCSYCWKCINWEKQTPSLQQQVMELGSPASSPPPLPARPPKPVVGYSEPELRKEGEEVKV
jgi:hypothetical protein